MDKSGKAFTSSEMRNKKAAGVGIIGAKIYVSPVIQLPRKTFIIVHSSSRLEQPSSRVSVVYYDRWSLHAGGVSTGSTG